MSLIIDSKYTKMISYRLRNFKQKKDYLFNFSCPFCGDSATNQRKARGYVYQKGNNLFYMCHNCSAGTNVGNLVKFVDPSLHKEYILERYKNGTQRTKNYKRKAIDIRPPKFDKVEKQKVFDHAEWCNQLPDNHWVIDYIKGRKIPKEHWGRLLFAPKYKQFIDNLVPNHEKQLLDDARLVIPFYDEYNNLIAVSGRALETGDKLIRYVTIRTVDSDKKLLYGLDRVDLSKTVKIVEGPLDSLFLSNCVASADANLFLASKSIECASKVLVFDNEPRNKEVVKLIEDAVNSNQNVVIWPKKLSGKKDINDMILSGMTVNEIEKIISSNTFSGLEAKTNLVYWKKV